MTASTSSSAATISSSAKSSNKQFNGSNNSAAGATASGAANPALTGQQQQQQQLSFSSASAAFQQVKQTQASLARLSRVHQQLQQQQQQLGQTNQSSQQQVAANKQQATAVESTSNQHQQKSTTFVDCLIRRFKDCFSEDFCTVPMFVVGSLSPGSDGTHLILPPCVSLGRQNINRFAGPKNLRLMNSIRDSCRSIEELDLGGNKINDLIEVYKILQCTPNLKFLNLSENDLSRTSPVAMAATCSSSPSSSSSNGPLFVVPSSSVNANHYHHQHWSSSSMTLSQRTCLGSINQNQQQAMGTRRHSTLGQSPFRLTTSTRSTCQVQSRLTEARRLAAAAAVAQSKKTSSSVASKLTNSATATSNSLTRPTTSRSSNRCGTGNRGVLARDHHAGHDRSTRCSDLAGQRHHQTGTTSTMNLARSLSSLSAKDVRNASSSLGRLSVHRSSVRKEVGCLRGSLANQQQQQHQHQQQKQQQRLRIIEDAGTKDHHHQHSETSNETKIGTCKREVADKGKPQLSSTTKLFIEPIAENIDDVDMGSEQQMSPNPSANISNSISNQHQQSIESTTQVSAPSSTTTTSKALSLQTGNSVVKSQPTAAVGVGNSISQTVMAASSSPNFRRTFESIKALALNNTGCQWRVVCSILSRMPNLEELHLSLNNYERIDLDPSEFRHHSLKRLYLCNNPKLTNWEELDKLLHAFPSLQALSIADCNISQIPDNLDRAREWRKLCGLNINGWPIKEWPVIERLNRLPSLIDLRCRDLEILNTIDEPRHHLIARLPKLQRLNGSEIEEREHAEKAFLRFFMANSHLERPSRFHELVLIHGEVTSVDVDVDLSPPSQANVKVIFLNRNHYCKENEDDILMSEDFLSKLMDNVDAVAVAAASAPHQQQQQQLNSLESMEVGDVLAVPNSSNSNLDNDVEGDTKLLRLFKDEGQEIIAIEVDLRQSVRKFKSTLASLFGLSSQNLILYYIDHEMVGLMGPELIKHNQKKLWNYNVQDGDQFIVEER